MSLALQATLLLALAAQVPEGLDVEARIAPRGDAGPAAPKVGEPFSLIIEARHRPGTIALLPEDLGLPEAVAERRGARAHRRRSVEGAEIDEYTLELLAFEAGEHELPAIPLAMGATVAKTAALVVLVESTLSADEQLVASSTNPAALDELEKMAAQSPPPERVLVPDYTLFWALGISALLIAAVVVLLRLSNRKRAEGPRVPPPPPPRPADEVALEALAKLRAEDPIAAGALKVHYTELSTILRAYLGGRYGFESLELTFDELFDALRARRTPGLDLVRLETLLFTADQVKFAKFVPLAEDGYAALETAEQIVRTTRPTPAPAEDEA